MAITAKATWIQSSDGLTVTLMDLSDYNIGGNPPATSYARTWVIRSSTGSILYTLPIPNGELDVSFSNTVDKFYSATLSFVGTPSVSDYVMDFGTTQIEANMVDARLINNCKVNCSPKNNDSLLRGFIYMNRAERSILYSGNGTRFNNFITASKLWLQS